MILAEYDINQENLCIFAKYGELDKLKFICELLDENGKNEKYHLDIAGSPPNWYLDNYLIFIACFYGKIDIIVYLLENWSHLIDITAGNNFVIRSVCENGHIEVVVYLMENWSHLIDITANNNNAIR